MALLHFPLCSPSTLQEDAAPAKAPVHDIRELFELAFPLTNERALDAEEEPLDNVIPLKP